MGGGERGARRAQGFGGVDGDRRGSAGAGGARQARMEAGQVVLVTCVVLVLGFLSSMYIAGMVTGHSVFNEAGHTEL